MRLRRALALVAVVGLVVSCQTAPTGGEAPAATPVYGGTLTALIEDDVLDLDPLVSRQVTDREVQYQIYDSLVGIDTGGRIVPRLARSWSFSEGGMVLTLELRSDVRFHDGTALDAASVKWNLDRYRTGKGSARAGDLASVEAVDALGSTTVRLTLKTPSPSLLAALVDRAGMIVSRKAVEAGGDDFTRKAFRAGTGPFVLIERATDELVSLERNPAWWGKDAAGRALPYLDKVVVRTVKSGDVRFTNIRTGVAQVTGRVAAKDVATAPSTSAGTRTPMSIGSSASSDGRSTRRSGGRRCGRRSRSTSSMTPPASGTASASPNCSLWPPCRASSPTPTQSCASTPPGSVAEVSAQRTISARDRRPSFPRMFST